VLALTPTAADAVRRLAGGSGLGPESGVRIAVGEDSADGSLEVEVTAGPRERDATIEREGARVYVESDIAPLLDDKLLDAEVEGEQVRFTVTERLNGVRRSAPW
jgi:Fe-S cluster assembly iron-binding protein IscA